MEFLFGILTAVFFEASVQESWKIPSFFQAKSEFQETLSEEDISEENPSFFLPRPENAEQEVLVFLSLDCPFCHDFFVESLIPLKNQILEKKLSVALSFFFLPTDQDSEKKIRDLLCVEKFAQKWESWIALRAFFESENPKNDLEKIADDFHFPQKDFAECRTSNEFHEQMSAAILLAQDLKIEAIPIVFIGERSFLGKTPPENLFWEIEKKLAENKVL